MKIHPTLAALPRRVISRSSFVGPSYPSSREFSSLLPGRSPSGHQTAWRPPGYYATCEKTTHGAAAAAVHTDYVAAVAGDAIDGDVAAATSDVSGQCWQSAVVGGGDDWTLEQEQLELSTSSDGCGVAVAELAVVAVDATRVVPPPDDDVKVVMLHSWSCRHSAHCCCSRPSSGPLG